MVHHSRKKSPKRKSVKKQKKSSRKWSLKYKRSINCNRPRGFSQKQYCKRKSKKPITKKSRKPISKKSKKPITKKSRKSIRKKPVKKSRLRTAASEEDQNTVIDELMVMLLEDPPKQEKVLDKSDIDKLTSLVEKYINLYENWEEAAASNSYIIYSRKGEPQGNYFLADTKEKEVLDGINYDEESKNEVKNKVNKELPLENFEKAWKSSLYEFYQLRPELKAPPEEPGILRTMLNNKLSQINTMLRNMARGALGSSYNFLSEFIKNSKLVTSLIKAKNSFKAIGGEFGIMMSDFTEFMKALYELIKQKFRLTTNNLRQFLWLGTMTLIPLIAFTKLISFKNVGVRGVFALFAYNIIVECTYVMNVLLEKGLDVSRELKDGFRLILSTFTARARNRLTNLENSTQRLAVAPGNYVLSRSSNYKNKVINLVNEPEVKRMLGPVLTNATITTSEDINNAVKEYFILIGQPIPAELPQSDAQPPQNSSVMSSSNQPPQNSSVMSSFNQPPQNSSVISPPLLSQSSFDQMDMGETLNRIFDETPSARQRAQRRPRVRKVGGVPVKPPVSKKTPEKETITRQGSKTRRSSRLADK